MDTMIEKHASLAAKILSMPVHEVKMYARCNESEGFIFFWNPADKGGSVIICTEDKTFLSANCNVSYADLLKFYKQGYRTN